MLKRLFRAPHVVCRCWRLIATEVHLWKIWFYAQAVNAPSSLNVLNAGDHRVAGKYRVKTRWEETIENPWSCLLHGSLHIWISVTRGRSFHWTLESNVWRQTAGAYGCVLGEHSWCVFLCRRSLRRGNGWYRCLAWVTFPLFAPLYSGVHIHISP